MESRVMGNCHARFGAGENLEERICSLRLHIPTKGLPIAILHDGGYCYEGKAARYVSKIAHRRAEPSHGADRFRVFAALPIGKHTHGKQKGL